MVKPCDDTHSRLRARSNQHTYVVRAAISDGSVKGEGAVAGDGQIVAAIILQHHSAVGAHKAHDRAADGVKNSRADDLNVDNIGIRGPATVGYRADLIGAGRLGENRNVICAAGGDQSWEREAAVGFDGKIIAAVVLQHYATASFSESGNRAADGEGSSRACNLDVADVRCGRATAISYGASLRGTVWLDIHGDEIRAANGDRRLKREGTAGGDRKVIAAIVLQNKPGASQTDDVPSDGDSRC